MIRKAFWVSVLAAVLVLPGCTDEQIAKMRQAAGTLKEQVPVVKDTLSKAQAQSENIEQAINSLPDGELKDKLLKAKMVADQTVEAANEFLEKAEPQLAELNAKLAEATDTLDVIDAGIQSAAPLLPVPWGPLLAAGGGLVVGLLRAAQNRKAARNIATSVQPILADVKLTEEQKTAIRATQGATGNRIVDESQGKKPALVI